MSKRPFPVGPLLVIAAVLATIAAGWMLKRENGGKPVYDTSGPEPEKRGSVQLVAYGADTAEILQKTSQLGPGGSRGEGQFIPGAWGNFTGSGAKDGMAYSFVPQSNPKTMSDHMMAMLIASLKLTSPDKGKNYSLRGEYRFSVLWARARPTDLAPAKVAVTFNRALCLNALGTGTAKAVDNGRVIARRDGKDTWLNGSTMSIPKIVCVVPLHARKDGTFEGKGIFHSDRLETTFNRGKEGMTSAEETFMYWKMTPIWGETPSQTLAIEVSDAVPSLLRDSVDVTGSLRDMTAQWFEVNVDPSSGTSQIRSLSPLPKICVNDSRGESLPVEIHRIRDRIFGFIPWGYGPDQRQVTATVERKGVPFVFPLPLLPMPKAFPRPSVTATWPGLDVRRAEDDGLNGEGMTMLVSVTAEPGEIVTCELMGSDANSSEPSTGQLQIVAGGPVGNGTTCRLPTALWYPTNTKELYLKFTQLEPGPDGRSLTYSGSSGPLIKEPTLADQRRDRIAPPSKFVLDLNRYHVARQTAVIADARTRVSIASVPNRDSVRPEAIGAL